MASDGVSEKSASDILTMLSSHELPSEPNDTEPTSSSNKRGVVHRAVWSENHRRDHVASANAQGPRASWGSWGSLTALDIPLDIKDGAKGEASRIDPTAEFARVRSVEDARYELRWTIESLLRQRGYKNQSPSSPSSIALLSRKVLDILALDVGLDRTQGLNHHQLSELLSSIVLKHKERVLVNEMDTQYSLVDSVINQSSEVQDLSGLKLQERVRSWLLESHCQAVQVIDTTPSSSSNHQSSFSSFAVLATAGSQRQAYSSGFAVMSRARQETDISSPQLIGSRGIDWVSVFLEKPDISIGVHVLTERARQFYKLEELLIDKAKI